MTTKTLRIFRLAAMLALCCCGTAGLHAQVRTGGTGGGTGGTGSRTGGSGSSSSGNYNSATSAGAATVTLDPDGRRVIVVADDKTMANVSNVIAHLDRPKPQVLINVVFIEVQHDDDLDLGIEGSFTKNLSPSTLGTNGFASFANNFGLAGLGTTGQQIGQSTMPTGAGLYSVVGQDFTATVRAIASKGKVEVLSRPSILVRNNQPATITVGQSVPLITGVTVNGLTGSPISTISYQNVGIILQVTPFITDDGLVEMIVSPQISSLSSQSVQISTNVFAPVIDLRSATTVVVTPDGTTSVIGGLMEKDNTVIDSKIPFLGDIPLLGNLFKHKQKAVSKKELMIFLTPHVVLQPSLLAITSRAETDKLEMTRKAWKDEELRRYLDSLPLKPMPPADKH